MNIIHDVLERVVKCRCRRVRSFFEYLASTGHAFVIHEVREKSHAPCWSHTYSLNLTLSQFSSWRSCLCLLFIINYCLCCRQSGFLTSEARHRSARASVVKVNYNNLLRYYAIINTISKNLTKTFFSFTKILQKLPFCHKMEMGNSIIRDESSIFSIFNFTKLDCYFNYLAF